MIANFISWVPRFTLLETKILDLWAHSWNWTYSYVPMKYIWRLTVPIIGSAHGVDVKGKWENVHTCSVHSDRLSINVSPAIIVPFPQLTPKRSESRVWDPETCKFSQLCRQPWGSGSILNNYFLLLFCENLNKWYGFFCFFCFCLKKSIAMTGT